MKLVVDGVTIETERHCVNDAKSSLWIKIPDSLGHTNWIDINKLKPPFIDRPCLVLCESGEISLSTMCDFTLWKILKVTHWLEIPVPPEKTNVTSFTR